MATKKSSTQNKAPAATAAKPENDNLNNPPKTEPVSDAEREAKAEELAKKNEARSQASDNIEAAIAPSIEGVEDQPEVKERVRRALGGVGETPPPTMVNGKSVIGKRLNENTGEWEDDPEAEESPVRAADIFDRIGEAFPHERQRLVIEEIARAAGLGDDATDLPEGMPTSKSTASLRTDVSGFGGYAAGGGVGARPVAPGKDGKAQAE